MNFSCNINQTERIARIALGVIILVGAIVGLGRWAAILISLVLIAEGAIGWCGIPVIMEKFFDKKQNPPQ